MLRDELCAIYANDGFASVFPPTGSQPALGLLNFQETLNPLMQRWGMKNGSTHSNFTHDLRSAVADLEKVNPWVGLWRFGVLGAVFLSLVALCWSSHNTLIFLSYSAIAGFVYAFWLICTHDMVHHTLTGWAWFDELMPRLISWPMLWPYGVYAQLHRLHHGWNGIDLRDPERVQWAVSEYQQAKPWMQWYVRHQWAIDLFGLGGLGLIAKTVVNAFRFGHQMPSLHRILLLDAMGMLTLQSSFLMVAASHHRIGHYVIFWLVLERIIGIIVQARDHLEHYALWGTATGHQLTQLYACRNLKTNPLVAWLMGGLNDHAIHHAFPSIPFNHLPEAFCRIQGVLEQHELPLMTVEDGYVRETLRLGTQPSLIGEPQLSNPTGRYQMIPL